MKLPKLITNQPVIIEKLVPGGQGIGTLDGKKGFFWNALPGETVTEFEITKSKSKYFEAIATKIENPSKHRIQPKDDCFLSTSPWQIMDYHYELEQKKELLKENFRQNNLMPHVDNRPFHWSEVQTDGKDFHYRNKMEYSLYWDMNESIIKLAFHQRGTHKKVPIITSSIERPEIFEKAKKIVAELNARHEEARKYQSLLLRANEGGEISGGLYENHQPHPVFDNLTDTILDQDYSYSPNGFFQINLPVYEMALKEIAKYIQTEKVLDLYAGVGTIGLSVARDKDLMLVESNKATYAELEKNCNAAMTQDQTSDKIKPILSSSEEALEYIAPDQTVIVDPPRAGCDKKLLEKLLEVRPEKIIYLSCNPATQARDIAILNAENQKSGKAIYDISFVIPFNFFPRTPHLENLVVLTRKN